MSDAISLIATNFSRCYGHLDTLEKLTDFYSLGYLKKEHWQDTDRNGKLERVTACYRRGLHRFLDDVVNAKQELPLYWCQAFCIQENYCRSRISSIFLKLQRLQTIVDISDRIHQCCSENSIEDMVSHPDLSAYQLRDLYRLFTSRIANIRHLEKTLEGLDLCTYDLFLFGRRIEKQILGKEQSAAVKKSLQGRYEKAKRFLESVDKLTFPSPWQAAIKRQTTNCYRQITACALRIATLQKVVQNDMRLSQLQSISSHDQLNALLNSPNLVGRQLVHICTLQNQMLLPSPTDSIPSSDSCTPDIDLTFLEDN